MAYFDKERAMLTTGMKIDQNSPGSILADIDALLRFVDGGVRSTGKYHLLPMARLFELDEMMTHPLRPKLIRPQQRAFPHINAMYVLLRALELIVPEGQGKTDGKLKPGLGMLEQWQQFNDTERYFALLETWLRFASFDILCGRDGGWADSARKIAWETWLVIARCQEFDRRSRNLAASLRMTEHSACSLALFELFGMMTVELDHSKEGGAWPVSWATVTPWGAELIKVLFGGITWGLPESGATSEEFGAWRTVLQPVFPEYVNVPVFYRSEFIDGTYYFKVALGNIWRRISITACSSLEDLADSIIGAFGFDGDHLYQFRYVARNGTRIKAEHPSVSDTSTWVDEILIGDLPLRPRQSMDFTYDFGANWRFSVKLEKVESGTTKTAVSDVIESHGEAPEEYGFDDEW